MEVVDVAVVGAGPAGSTLAALLAARGVSVAIIDRDELPRDKVCGEFLSYDALPVLERLGVTAELDRLNAPPIDHCRIVGSRRTYEFAFPQSARGVSRYAFDEILLRNAAARGAMRLDGWTATELLNDGRGVVIERDGERRTIRSAAVAGAWGRWGRFDQQLQRSFVRDRSRRHFGFKRHYRALAPHRSSVDLYSFRSGYLGVSAVEAGVTNICGLVHARRLKGLKGGWDAFVQRIRGEERHLNQLYAAHEPAQEGFLSSDPVIFRARSTVEHGIFMIGDASGMIDPLTGSGMAIAIQSALIAAPIVLAAVSGPSDRVALAKTYRTIHSEFFDARIAWSRRAAFLLSQPALLDASLGALRSPLAGRFFLNHTRASNEKVARLADAWFSQPG